MNLIVVLLWISFYLAAIILCFETLTLLMEIASSLELMPGKRWKLFVVYALGIIVMIPLLPFCIISYLWRIFDEDDDEPYEN